MPSFEEKLFTPVWRLVSTWPRLVVILGVLLAVASVAVSAKYLRLDSNQDHLVSPELPFQQRYLDHLTNFGDQEYLFVVIQTGGSVEGKRRAREFADALAARLENHPDYVQALYYKLSPAQLGPGALLYASEEQVEGMAGLMQGLAPAANRWMGEQSLPSFFGLTAGLFSGGMEGGGKGGGLSADPALFTPAMNALGGLAGAVAETLEGKPVKGPLFSFNAGGDEYFFTKNGRLLIMRVLPAKNFESLDVVGPALGFVRDNLQAVREAFPDVDAGLTGRPALSADEMDTTNTDMTRASIIAVVLVGILFLVVLHGWLRAVLVVGCLLLAMSWTFGFATLVVGRLNLLSIVFALVLVGIGADFGVHVVMRFVEEVRGGKAPREAARVSVFKTGPGITVGALTSVCAFYAVLGSDFQGLAELGAIGGTGILLCLLCMLTVLPALLILCGEKNLFPAAMPRLVSMPFLGVVLKRPGLVLLAMGVLTVAAAPGLRDVRFNYNLLELQARGLESVKYEEMLIHESDESTWFAIMTADNLDGVRALKAKLEKVAMVGRVETILDYLPKEQRAKREILSRAARALDPVPAAKELAPPRAGPLARSLEEMATSVEDLQEKLFAAGAEKELAQAGAVAESVYRAMEILEEEPAKAASLAPLAARLQKRLLGDLRALEGYLSPPEVGVKELPEAIRNMFVGKDGRYQLKVSPTTNVWEFDELERFVDTLRTIDPQVSGVPVGVYESAKLMHRTFLSAAGLTLALVSVLLFLFCRSLLRVGLTLLPLGVSMLWLLEWMWLFDLSFNLANFFAIPILIAIGVDGGVHLLARAHEIESVDGLYHTSTPTAVALSFATTMIGFGGLLIAHHRGLASLGAVMVLGSATGMAACLLVLPAVMKRIGYK